MADEQTDEWRRRAAELADELRAIHRELVGCSFDPEDLAAALELARQMRRRLAGPARPRWYESFDGIGTLRGESADAYVDQSPIRGRLNPVAPPLVFEPSERSDGKLGVAARAHLTVPYEGPPHGVHGGWVAALFDEVLGSTQRTEREPGVTAVLTVRYRHVTPLEEELRFEGWVDEDRGRSVVARATCHAGELLTAEAEGLFVRVDFDEVRERMRSRRGPDG
jgi:acyl-coenzyme A thioesterase PaaI-like protein